MSTTTEQMIITAPETPAIPSFLKPTERYNNERQRLGVAVLVESEAKRMADIARHAHRLETLKMLETQVALPFQKLLDADERYGSYRVDGGENEVVLTEEERADMEWQIQGIYRRHKNSSFPEYMDEHADTIKRLLIKYAAAIAENHGMKGMVAADYDTTEKDGCSWHHVWKHMIAANAPAVRAAD